MNTEQLRRTRLLWGVTALILFALGFLVGRWTDADDGRHQQSRSPIAQTQAERFVHGVPVGYPRTQEGAIQAATNFTRVMASALENPDTYRAVLMTMAAPSWVSDAERVAENGIRFFKDRYGLGGSSTFSPLRYRVNSYSNTRATIQLWGVTVATGPRTDGIEESWLTGTVELSWVSGDWRIADQSSEPGPTPELLQSGSDFSSRTLEGFKEYRRAPQP